MSSVWDVLEGKALQVVPGVTLDAHQHSISPGISRWEPASWVGASVNHDGGHGGGLRSIGHCPGRGRPTGARSACSLTA